MDDRLAPEYVELDSAFTMRRLATEAELRALTDGDFTVLPGVASRSEALHTLVAAHVDLLLRARSDSARARQRCEAGIPFEVRYSLYNYDTRRP